MKNILVIGGAGFIGSNLCENLLQAGYKVIVLDSFDSYYNPIIKRNNIKKVKENSLSNKINLNNLNIIEGDIRDISFLNKVFNNKIDVIIHLAAIAGVIPSISSAELYYDTNIKGTLNILEKCRQYGVNKLIFASSSSVYGDRNTIPFKESDRTDKPLSPYAATKKAGENLCYVYHYLYNIDIICLRLFSVYGPRQRPDLAICKFIDLAEKDKVITIYGDGESARSYTYINDVIDGIVSSINYLINKKGVYEIINIGTEEVVTINKVISVIEEKSGKKIRVKRIPLQRGEMKITCADISYAGEKLGYKPTVSFESGIEKYIKWRKK